MLTGTSVPVSAGHDVNEPRWAVVEEGKLVANELLSSYCDVVRCLGGNPEELLAEVAIDPACLQQSGGQVSLRAAAQLFENTAQRLNCPDFGLHLAERRNGPAIMKPLERLICNAPTVGDSMRYTMWHMGAYTSGIRATLEHDVPRQMRFFRIEVLLDGFATFPQLSEHLALLTQNAVIKLSGGAARCREIWFSHLKVSRLAAYAKRFGCAVKFGQAVDGLFLKESDFNAKVVECDTDVFVAESRLVAAQFPAQPPGIEVRVRQAIGRALAEADCTREQVAASLGMHSRTLQRRLGRIGMSFESIRDEIRRNLAVRYLARSDLYFTEIAGRLGYSEPAVLSRSCRRWFSATPSELRRNLTRWANQPPQP